MQKRVVKSISSCPPSGRIPCQVAPNLMLDEMVVGSPQGTVEKADLYQDTHYIKRYNKFFDGISNRESLYLRVCNIVVIHYIFTAIIGERKAHYYRFAVSPVVDQSGIKISVYAEACRK
jgi:hypothetical protein